MANVARAVNVIAVYLAGRLSARSRLLRARMWLEGTGHIKVTSRWLDAPGDASAASRDLADIDQANWLILDTYDGINNGGCQFETGYAHARGKLFIVVGPTRGIFHSLAWRHFDCWDNLLDAALTLIAEGKPLTHTPRSVNNALNAQDSLSRDAWRDRG